MTSAMKIAAGQARAAGILALSLAMSGFAGHALANKVKNPVAVFSGLDKITGRTTSFDVYIGETVQFGALQVTPRVCYSRDQTEAQKIDGFVEVDEITLDRKIRRIFTGWMFAASPGLNAVDHPIYDVWLTDCKQSSDVPAPAETKSAADSAQPTGDDTQLKSSVQNLNDQLPKSDTETSPELDPNVDLNLDPGQ